MISRRKLFTLLLAIVLTASLSLPAFALNASETKAQALYDIGMFQGKGVKADGSPDFALEDEATREAAATMLIRMLGKESKATAQFGSGALICPFTDVADWAKANVTYLYENNFANGTSETTYGGKSSITAQQFATLLLRSLDYSEANGDFTYAKALDFAVSKGVLTSAQRSAFEKTFNRGGMVEMCYNALYLKRNQSRLTLLDKLTADGVFLTVPEMPAKTGALSLSMKYQAGGQDSRWYVQEATVCPPVVTDIDNDGALELLYTARSIFCLDAASGKEEWRIPSGAERGNDEAEDFGRAVLPLQAIDIDGNGTNEIVTVHTNYSQGRSCVAVYDADGGFMQGWPIYTNYTVRAMHIADLDGDGAKEICFGLGVGETLAPSIYVYEADGSLRPGWPQVSGYGMYSDSMTTMDLDNDSEPELVMLYDDHFVTAFQPSGHKVMATGGRYSGMPWAGMPVCEDYAYEMKCVNYATTHGGYAFATADIMVGNVREDRNCISGTGSGITVADMDGDGREELVCTAMIIDGAKIMRTGLNTFDGVAQYYTTFILNADRTRYKNTALGFDWEAMPTDPGEILSMDKANMENANNSPVAADVDGDGLKEILYSANDGKLHCWSLDKTEHGAWPFAVTKRTSSVLSFATKPVCADLNGDGKLEVIFASYTQTDQLDVRGKLYVLDCAGRELASVTLPVTWGSTYDHSAPNGCMAQPCVADLDGDGRFEIALTTLLSGAVVYDVG